MSLDRVVIDFDGAFGEGQIYVALSRCRKMENIMLARPIQESDIKIDSVAMGFLIKEKINSTPLPEIQQFFCKNCLDLIK